MNIKTLAASLIKDNLTIDVIKPLQFLRFTIIKGASPLNVNDDLKSILIEASIESLNKHLNNTVIIEPTNLLALARLATKFHKIVFSDSTKIVFDLPIGINGNMKLDRDNLISLSVTNTIDHELTVEYITSETTSNSIYTYETLDYTSSRSSIFDMSNKVAFFCELPTLPDVELKIKYINGNTINVIPSNIQLKEYMTERPFHSKQTTSSSDTVELKGFVLTQPFKTKEHPQIIEVDFEDFNDSEITSVSINTYLF